VFSFVSIFSPFGSDAKQLGQVWFRVMSLKVTSNFRLLYEEATNTLNNVFVLLNYGLLSSDMCLHSVNAIINLLCLTNSKSNWSFSDISDGDRGSSVAARAHNYTPCKRSDLKHVNALASCFNEFSRGFLLYYKSALHFT